MPKRSVYEFYKPDFIYAKVIQDEDKFLIDAPANGLTRDQLVVLQELISEALGNPVEQTLAAPKPELVEPDSRKFASMAFPLQ